MEENTIYAGNLPYELTEEELEAFFAEAGEVAEAKIIKFKDSGRSKGYGFVKMADSESAEAAIEKLNGQELKGRAIKVNHARAPREQAMETPVAESVTTEVPATSDETITVEPEASGDQEVEMMPELETEE